MLGEFCRYDGKTKEIDTLKERFEEYEIISFCPEAPLFGTPRERISVVEVDGINRIITDRTRVDVTELLEKEIEGFIELHQDVDSIVLKSKSPSCGYKTTPILNHKGEVIRVANGIAAEIFIKEYKEIAIKDENSFLE